MENRCICCGEIIPEGRQACPACYQAAWTILNPLLRAVRKAFAAATVAAKLYPNKRVLHLALHSKSPRVKRKNWRRFMKWVEKTGWEKYV